MDEALSVLAEKVLSAYKMKNKTFGTAESCTGGLIAKTVTDIPGSSVSFFGGIVSYDNSVKERVLSVSHDTLDAHGAVSKETACEMVEGALRVLGVDCAVAVTGIAGPDGGTEEKPVGLVYIAAQKKGDLPQCRKCLFDGDRKAVREQTAQMALTMLLSLIGL